MSIANKKIAVFIAAGFEDPELVKPVEALKDAGAEVTLIGLTKADKQGVTGKHGTMVKADKTIDEVEPEDFEALVIPGGRAPSHLRQNQKILDFTRSIDEAHKPLAAICHGPQVLASADLLKGRNATSFFTVAAEVKKAGGRFSNKPVIIDGNLITSRMPRDIPAFIEAVFDALDATEEESRRKIA
ncbi:MAG: type 1 glutamine amidotransferase [Actinobacteria bacterium]|nr:type 1 glutamine amidotransferase [Actinomycetota bacterium]